MLGFVILKLILCTLDTRYALTDHGQQRRSNRDFRRKEMGDSDLLFEVMQILDLTFPLSRGLEKPSPVFLGPVSCRAGT